MSSPPYNRIPHYPTKNKLSTIMFACFANHFVFTHNRNIYVHNNVHRWIVMNSHHLFWIDLGKDWYFRAVPIHLSCDNQFWFVFFFGFQHSLTKKNNKNKINNIWIIYEINFLIDSHVKISDRNYWYCLLVFGRNYWSFCRVCRNQICATFRKSKQNNLKLVRV